MGGIFNNPTYTRGLSKGQKLYLKSKKTDRKPVEKREQSIQIRVCDYIRRRVPGINFSSDTGSGAFNSKFQKNTHSRQQSAKGLPDLTIFASRRGWHALLIELKDEGYSLKMKRNGTKIAVVKDSRGRIIERDYKIRMKGDWKSLHIERQAIRHEELKKERYLAMFACGYDEAVKLVDWYFDLKPEPDNATIF